MPLNAKKKKRLFTDTLASCKTKANFGCLIICNIYLDICWEIIFGKHFVRGELCVYAYNLCTYIYGGLP